MCGMSSLIFGTITCLNQSFLFFFWQRERNLLKFSGVLPQIFMYSSSSTAFVLSSSCPLAIFNSDNVKICAVIKSDAYGAGGSIDIDHPSEETGSERKQSFVDELNPQYVGVGAEVGLREPVVCQRHPLEPGVAREVNGLDVV